MRARRRASPTLRFTIVSLSQPRTTASCSCYWVWRVLLGGHWAYRDLRGQPRKPGKAWWGVVGGGCVWGCGCVVVGVHLISADPRVDRLCGGLRGTRRTTRGRRRGAGEMTGRENPKYGWHSSAASGPAPETDPRRGPTGPAGGAGEGARSGQEDRRDPVEASPEPHADTGSVAVRLYTPSDGIPVPEERYVFDHPSENELADHSSDYGPK